MTAYDYENETLREFMARSIYEVSPQMARGLQATENAWRKIEKDYGLLNERDVCLLTKSHDQDVARNLFDSGEIIGVNRRGQLRYPGFQFNIKGEPFPNIKKILKESKTYDLSQEELVLWMDGPSGSLGSKRPVECLEQFGLIKFALGQSFGVIW